MKNLIVGFALLCVSLPALAADPCASLQGKALSINGNGFTGVIGPNGLNLTNQNGIFKFTATANFQGEPADPVQGQCTNRHITFNRTRSGKFVQDYDGWIFENDPKKMAGVFSHNGPAKKWGWFADVKILPAPLSCKDICDKEEQDCHQSAIGGAQHAACTQQSNTCRNACP